MHGQKGTTRGWGGEALRRAWSRLSSLWRGRASAELPADAVRVARQIHVSGRRVVGFLPASSKVPTSRLCRELGTALARLYGKRVAWLDLGATYRAQAEKTPDAVGLHDEGLFAARWLEDGFLWVAPEGKADQGVRFQLVETMIAYLVTSHDFGFEHVLVDLAGFDRLGELLGTLDHLEGVIVVGRAGRTRYADLERVHKELPRKQNLGVLLTQ